MLPFDDFDVLTFDCYGTLIDWETGLWAALQPILAQHRIAIATDEALALYGALESEAERGPYHAYRMVLRMVLEGFGARLGFVPTATELQRFAASVPAWPPFPDSAPPYRHCIQNTSSPSSRTLMTTCSPCQPCIYTSNLTGLSPHNRRSPTSLPCTISVWPWHASECRPRKSCMSPRASTMTSRRPRRLACPPSGSTDAMRSQVLAPRPQRRRSQI